MSAVAELTAIGVEDTWIERDVQVGTVWWEVCQCSLYLDCKAVRRGRRRRRTRREGSPSILSYPAPLWHINLTLSGNSFTNSASNGPVIAVESFERYIIETSSYSPALSLDRKSGRLPAGYSLSESVELRLSHSWRVCTMLPMRRAAGLGLMMLVLGAVRGVVRVVEESLSFGIITVLFSPRHALGSRCPTNVRHW